MKYKLLLLVFTVFSCYPLLAQENKTIKEVTTVKKVITKEGSQVNIKKVEKTATEKGAIVVEDNDKEEQAFTEDSKKDTQEKVVKDDVLTDAENEALIAKQKAAQEKALQASIEEKKAKAEEERRLLEEQRLQRLKELEERRKKLEKRPKGMSKLKKN